MPSIFDKDILESFATPAPLPPAEQTMDDPNEWMFKGISVAPEDQKMEGMGYLENISHDTIFNIMEFLDAKSFTFFSRTCREVQKLSKNAAKELLQLVMEGKATKALTLLKNNLPDVEGDTTTIEECIALVTNRGIERHSGRISTLSPIHFLVYSGSYHLLEDMINIIPPRFYPLILQQVGEVIAPLHDLNALLDTYGHYLDLYPDLDLSPDIWEERAEPSMEHILALGRVLKTLPIVTLQWYCNPTLEYNKPPKESLCLANDSVLTRTQISQLGEQYILRKTAGFDKRVILLNPRTGDEIGRKWYDTTPFYQWLTIERSEFAILKESLESHLERIKHKLRPIVPAVAAEDIREQAGLGLDLTP